MTKCTCGEGRCVSFLKTTHCLAWKQQIVLPGNDESFCLERTNRCVRNEWTNRLDWNNASFCLVASNCLAWHRGLVLFSEDGGSCLTITNRSKNGRSTRCVYYLEVQISTCLAAKSASLLLLLPLVQRKTMPATWR